MKIKEKKQDINRNISLELLGSYRNALYAIKGFLDRAAKNLNSGETLDILLELKISQGISDIGKDIGKNIESLDKLEDKVKREETANISRKGSATESLFEV